MLYRTMPKTDEELSILGFGCMRLPVIDNDPSKIDEDKAIALVRDSIDRGVNYIDTAYPYHGTGMGTAGESEPFVARALKDGYREKVKLATKLPSWLIQSREDMHKYLNEQLQRLETDCIDYYLVHALNKGLWETLAKLGITDFLDQAIADGRIRHAGFSFHDNSVELFKEIVDAYDWTFCQIQYNYIDENNQAGREGLEYAAGKGLGLVIMEPLRGGSLAAHLPEEAVEAFGKADDSRTPADWALRWIWNHSEVSVVLSGMNAMEQVEENCRVASEAQVDSMTDTEIATVDEVRDILSRKVKVGCTGCGYCMPCPAGVNIPQNFTYLNDFHRFDNPATKQTAKYVYNMLLSAEEKSSNCVECGQCEEHCPQGIKIRDMLKEVTETLSN